MNLHFDENYFEESEKIFTKQLENCVLYKNFINI